MTRGMYESIDIDASAEDVYRVAADVETYPEWAQGVRSVEVHETDDTGLPVRASFVIEGIVKEIRYTLTYGHDVPSHMSWEADEGPDVRELTGSYEFAEADGRTTVTYALRVEPSFRVPGFLVRQGEKQIVQAALRGLKKRVETGA